MIESHSEINLGSVISTLKGNAFKSKDYAENGFPLIRVSDFTSNSVSKQAIVYVPYEVAEKNLKYQLKTGDILIQTVGSWQHNPASIVGKVVRVPKNLDGALLNQNAVKLIPSPLINKAFLYYRLKDESFKSHVIGCAQGAANQASITLSTINAFLFYLPPLQTQRKIAAILSAYDDLIENNLQRIKLLEEMAQITYEEWFVRMKFPGHETAQWDKATGLPEGWAKIPLGNMMIFHYGKGLRSHEKREGNVPIYSSAGIFGYHDTSLVDAPGIIVGRKGNVGSVFWSQEPFFPMDTTYYIESKESLYFAYFALKSVEFINNDAAVPGLNRNAAYAMKIISPVSELIERFEEKVKPAFVTIFNLKKQNELLREAREILLPRLMTGVIDVDQVEVPEALLARVA
ncbi:restriction endonuclease subunit S [Thiothrix lacustris]|uniref:restriction endonuclease subunit S n=1 Tax=Thiothrix lacustris TaxID=525917 RepID=UPI000A0166A7|nr:restriction endonuclease subunit S [Thiothrix lacustris]